MLIGKIVIEPLKETNLGVDLSFLTLECNVLIKGERGSPTLFPWICFVM